MEVCPLGVRGRGGDLSQSDDSRPTMIRTHGRTPNDRRGRFTDETENQRRGWREGRRPGRISVDLLFFRCSKDGRSSVYDHVSLGTPIPVPCPRLFGPRSMKPETMTYPCYSYRHGVPPKHYRLLT